MISKTFPALIVSLLMIAGATAASLAAPGSPIGTDLVQITTLTKPGGIIAVVSSEVYEGFAFSTDSSDYALGGISVSLASASNPSGTGSLQGNLYIGDHYGKPFGPSLGTLSTLDVPQPSQFAPARFTPDAPLKLKANTSYVFAVSATPGATNVWNIEFTYATNGFDFPAGYSWRMTAGRTFWVSGIWSSDYGVRVRAAVDAAFLQSHADNPKPNVHQLGLIRIGPAELNSSFSTKINEHGQVLLAAGVSDVQTGATSTRSFLYSHGETLKDLGTLGGVTTAGQALTNSGLVAGVGSLAGEQTSHTFLYSCGVIRDLGTLPGFSRTNNIQGMNDRAEIVGYANSSDFTQWVPFLYSQGTMMPLEVFHGSYAQTLAINKDGLVAGTGAQQGSPLFNHAVLYNQGTVKDLGTLGGSYSGAVAINSAGQIAGASYLPGDTALHPFLYFKGVMKDLGLPTGSIMGYATGLSEQGDVVGGLSSSDFSETRIFLYTKGRMQDLGYPTGFPHALSMVVNKSAQVAGSAYRADFSATHAFYASGGILHDLNDLCAALLSDGTKPGFVSLDTARDINDDGLVIGDGTYFDGLNSYTTEAFLLDTKSHVLK